VIEAHIAKRIKTVAEPEPNTIARVVAGCIELKTSSNFAKKKVAGFKKQVTVELVLADILSMYKPFVLLTDLCEAFYFFWLAAPNAPSESAPAGAAGSSAAAAAAASSSAAAPSSSAPQPVARILYCFVSDPRLAYALLQELIVEAGELRADVQRQPRTGAASTVLADGHIRHHPIFQRIKLPFRSSDAEARLRSIAESDESDGGQSDGTDDNAHSTKRARWQHGGDGSADASGGSSAAAPSVPGGEADDQQGCADPPLTAAEVYRQRLVLGAQLVENMVESGWYREAEIAERRATEGPRRRYIRSQIELYRKRCRGEDSIDSTADDLTLSSQDSHDSQTTGASMMALDCHDSHASLTKPGAPAAVPMQAFGIAALDDSTLPAAAADL
jgi:hypothetical protein